MAPTVFVPPLVAPSAAGVPAPAQPGGVLPFGLALRLMPVRLLDEPAQYIHQFFDLFFHLVATLYGMSNTTAGVVLKDD